MEKGYIILAHRNPEQLYRLLKRLDDNHATFFIHIDKKVPITYFNRLLEFRDKIHLVDRVVSNWAEFGLVQATINALKAIKETGNSFDRIILLSGQDYPIKNNQYLDTFFSSSTYKVFIESVIIPDFKRWKPGGGMYRINKYFFGLKSYQRYSAKALNFLGIILPFFRRNAPRKYIPYAGSQWWIIDMHALNYILEFIKANKSYYSFHKSTFAPDEVFFHGILLNATDPQLKESISNEHLHFMNWEDTSKGHPETLRKQDFENISQSKALFARKFDPSVDEEVLDWIDRNCLAEKKPAIEPVAENHHPHYH
jgi:hypothetical protein